MRVKIIRWTDPTSSQATLRVQRWCDGQWEPVRDFSLNESEPAHEFAMKLSMSKRIPAEVAVFEDGEKIERPMPLSINQLPKSLESLCFGADAHGQPSREGAKIENVSENQP